MKRSLHNVLLAVLVIALCLTYFIACSQGTPTEADAIKYLNDQGVKDNNLYKVKSLKKTNGKGNKESYIMDFDVELECLRTKEENFLEFNPDQDYKIRVYSCEKGEVVKRSGKLGFVKSEQGWVVYEGMHLY